MYFPPKVKVRNRMGHEANKLALGSGALLRCLDLSCKEWRAVPLF